MSPLRIALVRPAGASVVAERLAAALRDDGHTATVVAVAPLPAAAALDGLLRRRGFAEDLPRVPLVARALGGAAHDVVHVFSPQDALGAIARRRLSGRPIIFTCTEPPARERLADRRLRLALLTRAIDATDVVLASSESVRDALVRWLAVEVPVVTVHDAPGHLRIYREAIGQG